jgi:S1-C subfamily serine protease
MRNKLIFAIFLLILFSNSTTNAGTQTDEEKAITSAQKLIKSSVSVETGLVTGGSGFYISPDTVITNEHVIRNIPSNTVNLIKKSGYTCTGTVGYREEKLDLAIIHSSCTSDTVLTLNTDVAEGQTVLAFGSPQLFPFTLSKGIVSSLRWNMIQFDAKVTFGSSGGVLANLDGEVIGVVAKGAKDTEYVGFAILASDVKRFIERSKE